MKKKLLNKRIIISCCVMVLAFVLAILLKKQNETANTYTIYGEQFVNDKSPIFSLPEGEYLLTIDYTSHGDAELLVAANNSCNFRMGLPATGGELNTVTGGNLMLLDATERGYFFLDCVEESDLKLSKIQISSYSPIYRDYLYYAALVLFAGILIVLFMVLGDVIFKTSEAKMAIYIMVGVLIASHIPFLSTTLRTGVDLRSHLMRINGIYMGFEDHQFPAVLYPNFNNNFGQIGVLYPNLFLFFPAILRLLTVSLKTAYFSFVVLINVITMICAYISFSKISRNELVSAIGAVVYYLMPYRMRLMLTGGGIGGAGIGLAFMPMAIVGVYLILKSEEEQKAFIMLSVGMAGVFSSHIVSTLFTVILLVIICLVYFKDFIKVRTLLELVKSVMLFLLLTTAMSIPFLDYYFEDWNKSNFGWGSYISQNGGIDSLIRFNVHYRLVIALIVIITGILVWKYRKNGDIRFKNMLWIISALAFIMSTDIFPWKLLYNVPFIAHFLDLTIQYQDRWLTICEPIIGVLIVLLIPDFMNDIRNRRRFVISFSLLSVVAILWGLFSNYYGYFNDCDTVLYDEVCGDIEYLYEDYLPNGTQSEWYESDAGNISNYDTVKIIDHSKIYTHITTAYTCSTDNEYIEYPLFYYKDYEAYDQDGKSLRVEKGERNYVRVYLDKCDDIHSVNLYFKVRKIYKFGYMLSAASFVAVIIYLFTIMVKKNKHGGC